ncbi:MAG: hypothetical protein DBY20_08690 [Coriobacteriia bacterium]|nr:MAG: hypothetical protein DBY20_08690 [Coriobacteriia bacterium]
MGEKEVQAEKPNAFLAAPNRAKTLTLVGIYIALLGSLIQSNTMSTLLAVAAADIGGTDYYSLASNLGGVCGIIVMPLWAYLTSKSPQLKRPIFAISMFIGAAVILIRAISPDMMTIVVTGTFYGFVSSGLFVVGYSMIRDMYGPEKAGTYLGVCGTVMMVGALVGPVVGGVIMDFLGWRVLCWIIWPIMALGGLIVLLFGVKVTKEQVADLASTRAAFDVPGTIFMAIFLGAFVIALSTGTSLMRFGTLPSNIVFVVAAVAFVVFIVVLVKKKDAAIIPLSVFKDRNSVCFIISNFFSNIANMALFFFLPLYVIQVMGLSTTESGIIMACYSVAGLFLSPIYGKIIGKSGSAKSSILVVSVFRIIVALLFIFFLTPTTPMWLICIFMLIGGVYNCAGGSVFSAGPQVQLKPEIRNQANSVIQQMQTLGSSIGIAVFTLCIGIGGLMGGIMIAIWVSIVCAVIAGVAALGLKKLSKDE